MIAQYLMALVKSNDIYSRRKKKKNTPCTFGSISFVCVEFTQIYFSDANLFSEQSTTLKHTYYYLWGKSKAQMQRNCKDL